MSASDEDRTVSTFYRRQPGIGWLLALLAVPLLLALVGWGLLGESNGDEAAPPGGERSTPVAGGSASTPEVAASAAGFAPMSIVRNGTGFTLSGDVPNESIKTDLVDALRQGMPGAKVVDEFAVVPGVRVPDYGGLGGLFAAALDIPDFALNFDGTTLRLTGSAPSEVDKTDTAAAATTTWPNVKTINDIRVDSSPAPAPGGSCSTLQAVVTNLLETPITFATDGFTLAADSQRLVGRIADELKACPGVKVVVTGHTDDRGSDAVNVPLSADRAKSVADQIVSDGVNRSDVTSRGVGAADPVAGNDTERGRAQNRRVEITVSS